MKGIDLPRPVPFRPMTVPTSNHLGSRLQCLSLDFRFDRKQTSVSVVFLPAPNQSLLRVGDFAHEAESDGQCHWSSCSKPSDLALRPYPTFILACSDFILIASLPT